MKTRLTKAHSRALTRMHGYACCLSAGLPGGGETAAILGLGLATLDALRRKGLVERSNPDERRHEHYRWRLTSRGESTAEQEA